MFTILIALSAFFVLWYCSAVLFLYRGLRALKPHASKNNLKFSVVIAAHNEEHYIQACLQSVLSQTIAPENYEVIVVDDRSGDKTAQLVQDQMALRPNLALVRIKHTPEGISPKKHAVSQGVAQAKNDIIVFTDADCLAPPAWLQTIGNHFDETTGLVQGITTYQYQEGINRTFFGLQAIDFLSHGIIAAAAIGAGLPLNSNANNLAFRKQAFSDAGGYGPLGSVISGDDDLLLQRIWRGGKWRVRFMTDPGGAVQTAPTGTMRGVIEQRKRWSSKTVYYNKRQVLMLGGIFGFYCITAINFMAGFFNPPGLGLFALLFSVKLAGEYLLLIKGTALFNRKSLRPYILPASLLHLPLVLGAVLTGVFGSFTWKEQKYSRTA